jgi:hypothetical protein
MGERRHVYRFMVGKPEGKRPLERRRCRWEDNIKTDLQEVEWGMDCIDMVCIRGRWGGGLVNAVMNLRLA